MYTFRYRVTDAQLGRSVAGEHAALLGHGESQLVAANDTEQMCQFDQRVEIVDLDKSGVVRPH